MPALPGRPHVIRGLLFLFGLLQANIDPAMPLPTIPGVVRATFRGTNVAGQQWANVMHFRYADGASQPGSTEIGLLDAKVVRLYTGTIYSGGAPWLQQCCADTKLIDATYYVLNGTSVPQIIPHAASGSAATGNNTAQECAHVLTLRTSLRGRRHRGRIYLPAVGSNKMATTTGITVATVATETLAQANGLLGDLPSIQWKWVVASYGHGTLHGVPVSWTPYATDIASFSMDAIPDVQRRRKQ